MAIYAVGDLQGCLQPLLQLLAKVDFNPSQDQLWSTGDIVNRGPESLATLRYLYSLGASFRMVLGNHDLHLLAIASGSANCKPSDTLQEILVAADRTELLNWLQVQPLLISDHGYTMTHAGIPPLWSINESTQRAREIQSVLGSDLAQQYFDSMYGNQPNQWDEHLTGVNRWRLITNYLTRMRYCCHDGSLELTYKQHPSIAPAHLTPWFKFKNREAKQASIIFGHWASLDGMSCGDNLHALDTGCVWGGCLRLMELGSNRCIETSCASTG